MIEKITDPNLERYDSRLKEWCDKKFFEKGSYGKYQTTEESGAVAFYPAPNTLLEGKVKFSFKEIMPVSGDKGPDNPSTITGVTQVKVTKCRKNLLPSYSDSSRGIWTANSDGSVTAVATNNPSQTWFNLVTLPDGFVLHPGTYTISGCTGGSSSTYCFNFNTKKADGTITYRLCSTQPVTFTLTEKETVAATLYVAAGVTLNYTFHPQLEFAGTASNYEQAVSTDYTIDLGGTYYGGEIDLATGVMTVTHVGTSVSSMGRNSIGLADSWYEHGSGTHIFVFYFNWAGLPNGVASSTPDLTNWVCTHFRHLGALIAAGLPNINFFTKASSGIAFYIDIEESKLDLSGAVDPANPTNAELYDAVFALASQEGWFVVYPVAEPYTVQLTPTQILSLFQPDKYTPRLNTVYTDADSIQISYLKSPIRDEYEKTQVILSLGGNS